MKKSASTRPGILARMFSRVGRVKKSLVPVFRVLLGTSLVGKTADFVVRSSRRKPKSFFPAQVYSWPELVKLI